MVTFESLQHHVSDTLFFVIDARNQREQNFGHDRMIGLLGANFLRNRDNSLSHRQSHVEYSFGYHIVVLFGEFRSFESDKMEACRYLYKMYFPTRSTVASLTEIDVSQNLARTAAWTRAQPRVPGSASTIEVNDLIALVLLFVFDSPRT